MSCRGAIKHHKISKKLGQYFTRSEILQQKVFEFIKNDPHIILEPSVGRGDLVHYITQKKNNISFDMFEIDNNIDGSLVDKKNIIFCDFLKQNINKKYDCIVGNPPYVQTQKGNLYIEFIEKCSSLLNNNGELIFIIPSQFFKLTSSADLINNMLQNGSFTHIFHPNDEKLFDGAEIDVIVFRYCRGKKTNEIMFNDSIMYTNNHNGMITFSDKAINIDNANFFGNFFNIFVGFVSGMDSVFRSDELGNCNILWDRNSIKKFIILSDFPSDNKKINDHLLENKKLLIGRKIRKFNENNWFEWGGLRNISTIKNNIGKQCIYIRNMSRKVDIAFKSTVMYFGPGLFMLLPKNNDCDLDKIVNYINSHDFQKNFIYSGRFVISQCQLTKQIM